MTPARSRWWAAAFGDAILPAAGGGVAPDERWLAGVALGAHGRYAAAATVLLGLLRDPTVPAVVAAHAAVTLAAHRRQLGGHAAARPLDALGLRLATSATGGAATAGVCAAATARADALTGLAADALGLLDQGGAARLLDIAATAADRLDDRRPAVRVGWVEAELALLRGDPGAAVEPAQRAVAVAAQGGSLRHRLKSDIVAAVAQAAADPAAEPAALARLDGLAGRALAAGLLPLHWPAVLAAADLAGSRPAGATDTPSDTPGPKNFGTSASEPGPDTSADPPGPGRVTAPTVRRSTAGESAHPAACPSDGGPPDDGVAPRTGAATTRTALPPTRPGRPSGVRSAAGNANEWGRNRSVEAPNGDLEGAARRRHAAARTLSVLYRASDPIGRRLMGESLWLPKWRGVM